MKKKKKAGSQKGRIYLVKRPITKSEADLESPYHYGVFRDPMAFHLNAETRLSRLQTKTKIPFPEQPRKELAGFNQVRAPPTF